MLLHLPIAILATLLPITVSSSVPHFDIARECRYEGGSTAIFERCSQDETTALAQLRTEWAQFADSDQKACMVTTTTGGFASYVELLTCLEMARDVVNSNNNPDDPRGARHQKLRKTELGSAVQFGYSADRTIIPPAR
jgi:hypothetical protein